MLYRLVLRLSSKPLFLILVTGGSGYHPGKFLRIVHLFGHVAKRAKDA